ncbi:MAG: YDG domain-containing protein, partial [Dysosmobacter sp.]|nr:YDG domain-containing protein [Dysosmobacter sp.]
MVNQDVTIDGNISAAGTVNLILADGCTLTISKYVLISQSSYQLNIYGQSSGTGTLKINNESANSGGIENSGTLNIYGGNVTTTGSKAGIYGGKVNINGGTVEATGGSDGGAGISGTTINISGGEVTAKGGQNGAGIGGGSGGSGSTINISGTAKVTATGGENGAGIGGGKGGNGGTINISGSAEVTATSGGYGAGIGGGSGEAQATSGGSVTITSGTVTATGGYYGAGIGGGWKGSSGTIKISGGNVTAKGGQNGAGIGGGQGGSGDCITISGNANVTATSGEKAAGIGGGSTGGSGGNITISGGIVEATSSGWGAGIGGGSSGSGGQITITGGTVKATGGATACGAGIGGGGNNGSGGTIEISGGTVTANGGTSYSNTGAGIGGGSSGSFATDGSGGGNAIIYASSISDQSNKENWSGIIFEGNNGGVYGSRSLSSTFEVKSGQKLLIPAGVTLTTNGNLTNNGSVFMVGTVSGALSGAVYYPLTLTDCTASGATSDYNGAPYGKAGGSVTLTSAQKTGYLFKSWTVNSGDVTISDNSFTMPANAVAVTAQYDAAATITTQPQEVITDYGNDVTLSIVAKNSADTTEGLSYQWYKKENGASNALEGATSATLTLTKPNAGTYYYFCRVTYNGISIDSDTVRVLVRKLNSELITAPTASEGWVYDGAAHPLVTAAGTANHGTVKYSLNGLDYENTIPTRTNAGTYKVWYRVIGDENYNDTEEKSFTIVVSPRPVTVSGITAESKTYDGNTNADLVYTGAVFNDKLDGDTLTVNATGAFEDANAADDKTVNITNLALDGTSKDNYILAEEGQQATATATISRKEITPTIEVSGTYAYTGSAITPAFTVKDVETPLTEGDYTAVVTDNTAAGTGKITVTAKDTGNYSFDKAQETFTINPAALSASVTLEDWTYGDEPNTPEVTGNTENGEVTYLYKAKTAGDDAYSETVPTEAGEYTVQANIAATDNCQAAVVTRDFTIEKKTLTVTGLTATNRVYDGTRDVTLTGGTLSGVVSGDENGVSATIPDRGTVASADAGSDKAVSFTAITISGEKAGNYTLTQPTVTVNISQADPDVGTVTKTSPDTIYTTTELNNISLSRTNEAIDGTLQLTAGQALTAGTADYGWTFTPDDSTNYKTVIGTISLTVESDTLSSISTSGTLTKTSYKYGEAFQITGLTVTATYASGNTRDVTAEVIFGALSVGQTEITLSYGGKTCTVSGLTVDKADARTLADISVKQKYTTTSGEKAIGTAGMPADAGTLAYTEGTASKTGSVTVTGWGVDSTGEEVKVTYTLSGGAAGDTVTLPIKITSTNYADSTVNVVITLTDKDTPTATANDITVTYTGYAVPDSAITGTAIFGTASVAGIWSFRDGAPTRVEDSSDSVTVVFTPTDSTNYETVEDTIKVTINKATPTGTPTYTAISTSGKTLADAALAVGSIDPAGGSITWDLGDSQTVSANTAYKWTYTPTDESNYNKL